MQKLRYLQIAQKHQRLKTRERRGDGGGRLAALCRSKGGVVLYTNPPREIAHGKIDKNRELHQPPGASVHLLREDESKIPPARQMIITARPKQYTQ